MTNTGHENISRLSPRVVPGSSAHHKPQLLVQGKGIRSRARYEGPGWEIEDAVAYRDAQRAGGTVRIITPQPRRHMRLPVIRTPNPHGMPPLKAPLTTLSAATLHERSAARAASHGFGTYLTLWYVDGEAHTIKPGKGYDVAERQVLTAMGWIGRRLRVQEGLTLAVAEVLEVNWIAEMHRCESFLRHSGGREWFRVTDAEAMETYFARELIC